MQTRIAPYGAAGWGEKVRIIEELFSKKAGPPFLYNDVLLIVPSSRLRRTYGRLFLDIMERTRRSHALVQPEVQTLPLFLQRLSEKTGGPALIDENGRLVLLEGIVKSCITGKKAFGNTPDILAPSLSAAVAGMIEELSASGISPEHLAGAVAMSDVSDKPQVRLLMEAYETYERILSTRGLADPAGMLSHLADRFDPSWLTSYSTIIIDGLHDASELQVRVLRKIAAHHDCTFLVDAPSPDSIRNAGDYHPLRLLKEFMARVGLMVGGSSVPAGTDDRYLAEALFSARSFDEAAKKAPPDFRKDLRLLSAITMREEVSFIAGEVKRSLLAGRPPDSILVAFPSLDEYGPLAEELFTDFGIPYNRALGRQLSASPVTTAVVSLLSSCREDHSGPSLLRIFSSPFLKFGEAPSLAPALARLMADRRITGGRHKLLMALKRASPEAEGHDILTGSIKDLFLALDPFSTRDPAPLTSWMDRLSSLLTWSGLSGRVTLIKGPLNSNLQAYKKLTETLASLRQAGDLFPEYSYTFNEWLFLLKKTFMHTRYQVPQDDEGGVQVLGMEESIGHAWTEIYLGGLMDGAFPRRLPQNIFLPEATLEALGVRTLENARLNAASHFYRLLLSAPRVTLTWPENVGDKPIVPSPFLAELTPLLRAGVMKETRNVQFSLTVEDSRSIPELAKSLSLAGDITGLEKVLAGDREGMAGIARGLDYQPAATPGSLATRERKEYSVTELDDYLKCPYAYYVKHLLRISPLEEVSEDISALDRGSKVHSILRRFYAEWNGPVTAGDRDKANELLAGLADREFSYEADTFRNRREKDLFVTVMAERFLDAEEEFWKQGFRPAYLEQKIESFTLTLADGTGVELHGKIDRIDVDEHGNFIIVDYKTGGYPLPVMTLEQEIFQLPVYAVMALRTLADKDPGLKRTVGLAYYDLSGKNKGATRDLVLYDKEALGDQPSTKPKASPKSAADFEALLAMSMDSARRAIEGIRAGNFPSTPRDQNKCRNCPNGMMCGKEDS
ncbi:MAG: PD-(D/E)XK nuclease family protein [Nitrospirota bacterium]